MDNNFHDPDKLVLISGPCVIENHETAFNTASILKETASKLDMPFIFKASFDKANRSSHSSFRGPGFEKGINILAKIKERLDIKIISDIHLPEQAGPGAEILDMIQIPAFLCRQTDLIAAAARTGKPVNIKKGQFLSPWECKNLIEKARAFGCKDVTITERGSTFGYNNLVVDFRAIEIIASFGVPVIFDATHSVQLPGGMGSSSGGNRGFAPCLLRAAVAAGVQGIFIETHPDPDKALCDGPNSIPLEQMPALLRTLLEIKNALNTNPVTLRQSHESPMIPLRKNETVSGTLLSMTPHENDTVSGTLFSMTPHEMAVNPEMRKKLAAIKLLLLDVDGVMTDGRITYSDSGQEIKDFSVKDGLGMRLLMDAGVRIGIVTGRRSGALAARCRNLGIELLFDGIKDKTVAFREIVRQLKISPEEAAFVGDDLPDMGIMKMCGISFAVADAAPEVIELAHAATISKGGRGAVREICEALLKARNIWQDTITKFVAEQL
ncbi:MAG: 3-deoxy-8-phosphooctulonate synthase [Desulfamplus sp.]|nr:3-deoxy-8-phosphooctulonate synthase [Desulfamplus sp.]